MAEDKTGEANDSRDSLIKELGRVYAYAAEDKPTLLLVDAYLADEIAHFESA